MKRIVGMAFTLLWGLLLLGCDPINTFDQMGYIRARDTDGNTLEELVFPAEGGTAVVYVETTLPRWMARPVSLHDIPYTHPLPENGYITMENLDGWMTIKYRHALGGDGIDLFNGAIEVTVAPNGTGAAREDGVYIWNDDIPATLTVSAEVTIRQL